MAIVMIAVGIVLTVCGVISLASARHEAKSGLQTDASENPEFPESVTSRTLDKDADAEAKTTVGMQEQKDISDNKNIRQYAEQSRSVVTSEEADAKTKGNNFEAYVVDIFKNGNRFRVLEWHQGSTTPEGNYAENELNPDLKIAMPRDGKEDITFWVECKYRSQRGKEFRLPRYQYDRYRTHQRETRRKVLIALGIGGESSAPEALYIIPIDSIKADTPVDEKDMADFRIHSPRENMREYISDYFYRHVFAKSSKRHR